MKVGDYVRTKDGNINKIIQTEYMTPCNAKHQFIYLTDNLEKIWYPEDEIIKSSPNIIDLIEVGDIIRGKDNHLFEVYAVGSDCVYINNLEEFILVNEIKSIVTHEQFESMQYNLESQA